MQKTKHYWKQRQAAMAAALSIATYLYNSLLASPSVSYGPVVQISTGLIRGNYAKSREGRDYAEFLGVPFGKAPINELRFEPPQPVESWNDTILDTKYLAPECMQMEAMVTGRIMGEENCLFLNIFAPMITPNNLAMKLLPVMVFFHGGLFISGGSHMYRGKYFMDQDIILVVPQYRLGALGFLNTGDGVISGNMGLKDQNLALQWIQQNIQQFGGDPNSVTIFGNSAGGLFHKGISESGTAIKIWTLSKHPKRQALQFAKEMKCPTYNTYDMVNCLKKLDAKELVKPHLATMSPIRDNTDLFVPTIDGSFVPDDPLKLLQNGSFHKVPWLTGVNAGDGLLNTGRILASESIYKNLGKEWDRWIPRMLDYDSNRKDISSKIRKYYFGRFKGKYLADDVENITSIYSDRVYFHATRKAAMYHAQHAPTYLYYYSYPGEFSFFSLFKAVMPHHEDIIAPELKIAMDVAKDLFLKYVIRSGTSSYNVPCHADELPLLFNMHRAVEVTKNSKDYLMSQSLVKAWADFAKLDERNLSSLTYQNVPWPPINASDVELKYMNLDKRGSLINEPFKDSMKFWDSLNLY